MRHRRRRHRPHRQHIHAHAQQARGQRIFQHVARQPGILAQHRLAAAVTVGAENPGNRLAELQRDFRRDRISVGASPHAVGPKKFAHDARQPSILNFSRIFSARRAASPSAY
ncbi:hypothetical protein SDC9_167352 [bioreactor metagenome]|uniref:Uncharacterized protein n=1 Tax=bioreactor metagenome TaxID=1076179 RepID=A0A645FZJ4_9ZZZZ